jgi:hypothetical protein
LITDYYYRNPVHSGLLYGVLLFCDVK